MEISVIQCRSKRIERNFIRLIIVDVYSLFLIFRIYFLTDKFYNSLFTVYKIMLRFDSKKLFLKTTFRKISTIHILQLVIL